MAEVWPVALAARLVVSGAFAWIAVLIARNLSHGRQWSTNPVGVAAFLVFVSATFRSISHTVHAFGWWDEPASVRDAARIMLGSPLSATWAIVAAALLLVYLVPRARRDVQDASRLVAWDLRREQEEALLVQKQVQARLHDAAAALARGDQQACSALLDEALRVSRRVVADLLPARPRGGRLRALGGPHG